MRIGELAQRAGVRVDTVRYYEKRGILRRPARSSGGYRVFSEATLYRLILARELQGLGFTIQEIVALLCDMDRGQASCESERYRFETVVERIDEKLAALEKLKRRVKDTLRQCEANECSLIELGRKASSP
jgi:DNA-binding transcriptional MerR regulator